MKDHTYNILFIHPGGQFGYSAGYYYYCKYLSVDPKFNIGFICWDFGLPRMELAGVNVHYIPRGGSCIKRTVRWFRSVTKIISNYPRQTLVFTAYFKMCSILSFLYPFRKKVLDIRTGAVLPNEKHNKIFNKNLRIESKFYKHITILSLGLMRYLNISSSKCHLLPLGADILSNTEKDFSTIKLIYVGTLSGRRITDIVEGLRIFIAKYNTLPHVSLDIFGAGLEEEVVFLKASIRENDLHGIVTYHGQKNHQQLKHYFNECNIGFSYVPVTPYFEHQPSTKIFEYILAGQVCIATGTSENRKMINPTNGVICRDTPDSVADAISYVYENRYNYHSKAIRNTLNEYGWENIVNHNLKPYLISLINKKDQF